MIDIVAICKLQNLAPGTYVKFRALVSNIDTKYMGEFGSEWSEYYIVTLKDQTGTVNAALFGEATKLIAEHLVLDSVVDIRCTVKEFKKVVAVDRIQSVVPVPETVDVVRKYKPHSLRRLLPENEQVFRQFFKKNITNPKYIRYIELAYGLGRKPLGLSAETFLRRQDVIREGFCSIRRHDCYPGGLTNHIVGMLRIAEGLQRQYANPALGRVEADSVMNWDYVYTGIYLHDIGKQLTHQKVSPGIIRHREGNQETHQVAGCNILYRIHEEVEPEMQLSFSEYQQLSYTILNHSTKTHLFVDNSQEDDLIQLIDGMDTVCVDSLRM